jgi:PAS domain S-box-containing protein
MPDPKATLNGAAPAAVAPAAGRRNELVEGIVAGTSDGILAFDRDCRYTVWNPAMERISGVRREDVLGRVAFEVFPFLRDTGEDRCFREALAGRTAVSADRHFRIPESGREGFFEGVYSPLHGDSGEIIGGLAVIRDVTERKRAERQRAELEAERACRREAEEARRRFAFLAEAGAVLSSSLDYGVTLERVARMSVPFLADWCVVDVLEADGSMGRVAYAHRDPSKEGLLRRLQERYPVTADSPQPAARVVRSGRPEFLPRVDAGVMRAHCRDEEHVRLIEALEVRSHMAVPLSVQGRILGAVGFARTGGQEPFGPDDLALAEELARRAAVAIDNARLYRQAQAETGERKRAEQALREVEGRLAAIVDHSPASIFAKDAEGRYLVVNRAFAESAGRPAEGIVGLTDHGLFDRDTAERFRRQDAEVLADGRARVFEESVPYGGRTFTFLTAKFPLRDGEGRPHGVCGIATDITDRKRAEGERDAAARRVAAILDSVTDAYFALDRDWRFSYVNREARRLLGKSPEELLGRGIWDEYADARGTAFEREYRRAAEQRVPVQFQEFYPPLNTWFEVRAFPTDEGLAVYFRDVTERRRLDEELRTNRERLLLALDSAQLGTFYCDLPLDRLTWNDRCKEHFWLPPDAEVDIGLFYSIIHPDDRERTRRAVEGCVYGGADYDVEYRTVAPDGRVRWVRAIGRRYAGPDGRPARFDGITIDVTDRKRIEQERESLLAREREARREAEAANAGKDAFLSVLSHELRTPLNAILGWARMLREGALPEADAAEALAVIERNAVSQAKLVEDLLDVSRIVSGKLAIDPRPVPLGPVVRAALDVVRPAAEGKGVRLEGVIDESSGSALVVLGDADRLQQVVWNLLHNAVKFTPAGGRVTLGLGRRGGLARIVVNDTGEGIPADFLPLLFDRFRQADPGKARRHGGLGLGLALVKHLAELHGGTVSASSEGPGLGATFTVELPLVGRTGGDASPPNGAAHTDATAGPGGHPSDRAGSGNVTGVAGAVRRPLAGLRILLVDDTPDSLELIATVLRHAGAAVTTADCAAAAKEAFGRGPPDVLVSDIGMPVEDGYRLIADIRSLPAERGGETPAVALTGYASEQDRRQCLASGFQAHVAKPIQNGQLVAAVAALAGTKASPPRESAGVPVETG